MSMKCTRSEKIEVRLTEEEKQQLQQQAQQRKLNMASYARMKMFTDNEV